MRFFAVLAVLAGACSAPPEIDVAFVVVQPDEIEALQSALAGVTTIGFATADAPTQRDHVVRAIELGVRVIVLEPVAGAEHGDLVAQAHQRGVRVVAYGREPHRAADGDSVDALVAFDGYRAGVLQVTAALAAIEQGRLAILGEREPTGVASEIARGYSLTLAPYVARGDVTIVEDIAIADAVLAISGADVRSLSTRPSFVASVGGDNTDLVCAGRQQLDIHLDRADLAVAAGAIVKRLLAGEDLGKDPQAIRLPNRRLPVELAPVTAFTARDCAMQVSLTRAL